MQTPVTSDEPERLSVAIRISLLAFAVTRLPLVLWAWLINHHAPYALREGAFLYHGGSAHTNWLIDAFQKWDAYWFLNIVREGYQYFGPIEQISGVEAGQAETNVTPFPLYPLAMKAGAWIVGDPSVAGLLISQLALIAAMVALYRLARLDVGAGQAQLAVWLFALVPWSYAFSAIYSESLFFALTIGAMLAVRRQRYLAAGCLGMLAALTRLPGVLIVVPLLWEHLRRHGLSWRGGGWRGLLLFLVPLGTLSYFVYLYVLTGEPFAYFIAQEGWHKETVALWHHPARWLTAESRPSEMVLEMVVFALMLATLVYGFKRIRRSYWVYALVGFAVLMSSSNLLGLPRYCAGLFPLYLIWSHLGARRPAAGQALAISFGMLTPMVFWVWSSWFYAF